MLAEPDVSYIILKLLSIDFEVRHVDLLSQYI